MIRETLTSYAAVESLADAVVDRFPRTAEVEFDPIPVRPVIQCGGGELRPIVALDDGEQPATALAGIAEEPSHVDPPERACDLEGHALARIHVDEREHANRLPGGQHVVHEVHRPPLIRLAHHRPWLSNGRVAATPATWFELQPFLDYSRCTFL